MRDQQHKTMPRHCGPVPGPAPQQRLPVSAIASFSVTRNSSHQESGSAEPYRASRTTRWRGAGEVELQKGCSDEPWRVVPTLQRRESPWETRQPRCPRGPGAGRA